jgi:hypothetical protein
VWRRRFSSRARACRFWAISRRTGVSDLQATSGGTPVLVIVFQSAAQLCLESLDLLGEQARLLLEGLALGIGEQAVLRLRVGSVWDDLVDSVILRKELEAVLLTPAQPQTRDELGRFGGGSQVGQHGNLLPILARNRMVRIRPTFRKRVFFSNSL